MLSKFIAWLFGLNEAAGRIIIIIAHNSTGENPMSITLKIGDTFKALHAVEKTATGASLAGVSVVFTSSDPSVFTASPSSTDPLTAELIGVSAGHAVLGVHDAVNHNLHIAFDVTVIQADAAEIDLADDSGEELTPDADADPVPAPADTSTDAAPAAE